MLYLCIAVSLGDEEVHKKNKYIEGPFEIMGYNVNLREEELKNHIARDLFARYDCTPIIGNIDFAVARKLPEGQRPLVGTEYYLWAEAKKGNVPDIYIPLVQLILTIGRARTFDREIPPKYLGAFDAFKMAFVPYEKLSDVFGLNDFNWNVTPSNHESNEFKILYSRVRESLEENLLFFDYAAQSRELDLFIRTNFQSASGETFKLQITKTNFLHIFNKWEKGVLPSIDINWTLARKGGLLPADFYLADLLSDGNRTLIQKLYVLLESDVYKFDRKRTELGALNESSVSFNDKQKAHKTFWNCYCRPPKEELWDYMIARRDLLVPQDVREIKGAFYTPSRWVELSQQYIADLLGEDWQEHYYVWDCCAGTGNLLAGLANKYNIYASTLDKPDVDVMHERIRTMDAEARRGGIPTSNPEEMEEYGGANLLESHVFQFDFLNDGFYLDETPEKETGVPKGCKLPKSLWEILRDPEKRKKLVLYINPPYKETGNARQRCGTGKNQSGVANANAVYRRYRELIGNASNELFAQFFIRIYKELDGCILGEFSTLKILQGSNFAKFRKVFRA